MWAERLWQKLQEERSVRTEVSSFKICFFLKVIKKKFNPILCGQICTSPAQHSNICILGTGLWPQFIEFSHHLPKEHAHLLHHSPSKALVFACAHTHVWNSLFKSNYHDKWLYQDHLESEASLYYFCLFFLGTHILWSQCSHLEDAVLKEAPPTYSRFLPKHPSATHTIWLSHLYVWKRLSSGKSKGRKKAVHMKLKSDQRIHFVPFLEYND